MLQKCDDEVSLLRVLRGKGRLNGEVSVVWELVFGWGYSRVAFCLSGFRLIEINRTG